MIETQASSEARARSSSPPASSDPTAARGHLAGAQQSGDLVRARRRMVDHPPGAARARAARTRQRTRADGRPGRCRASEPRAGRRRSRPPAEQSRSLAQPTSSTRALETITGEGGVVVLVGEAGTGKGVVLDAAREAWERDGQRVIGTAIAGRTAQRLGADAEIRETMTDRLADRPRQATTRSPARSANSRDGRGRDGRRTTARQADRDHPREQLETRARRRRRTALADRCRRGLFTRAEADSVPTAELTEVHRAVRVGTRRLEAAPCQAAHKATLGDAHARGRLHIEDTRTAGRASGWSATGQPPAPPTPANAS